MVLLCGSLVEKAQVSNASYPAAGGGGGEGGREKQLFSILPMRRLMTSMSNGRGPKSKLGTSGIFSFFQ